VAESSFERKLRMFMDNNWNVLFHGKHGTGKSSVVKALWDSMGIKYRIFSAATMDPWVDFIGVPKERLDKTTGEMFLDLVRPAEFQKDEIEAIMLDELNRSAKKIRNAVMELIQFKSINGKKFNNLRVIWAAINPEDDPDEDYDVEKLDPAQRDRFHIHINMPYKLNEAYFTNKYGPEVAEASRLWWDMIKDPKVKNQVSPRRVDYALEVYFKNGSLEDVLPTGSLPSKLREQLKQTPALIKLREFMDNGDKEGAKKFLDTENNYSYVIDEIKNNPSMIKFFIPLCPSEKINSLISSSQTVATWALRNYGSHPTIKNALQEIHDAGTDRVLVKNIAKRFGEDKFRAIGTMSDIPQINPDKLENFCATGVAEESDTFGKKLTELVTSDLTNTYDRSMAYTNLFENMTPVMKLETAENALKVLDKIIKVTHRDTLKQWARIPAMINTCVENMLNGGYKFSRFNMTYPNILQYVVNREGFYFVLETKKDTEKKNEAKAKAKAKAEAKLEELEI